MRDNIDVSYIAKSLGKAKRYRDGYMCCCPAHNDRNPSLSITYKDGKLLLKCFAGCEFQDVLQEIKNLGLLNEDKNFSYSSPKAPKLPKVEQNKDKIKYIKKTWEESIDINSTLGEIYLKKHRNINLDIFPETIRFHSNLYHAPTKKYYPAIVSKVDILGKNELSAISRIFLDPNTAMKADIKNNKMMLGSVKNGVVKLSKNTSSPLVICEGIETGLSVYQATKYCVWCALSASNMQNISLPAIEEISKVIIASDNDEAGINSSKQLANRLYLNGYSVSIAIPKDVNDFNDMMEVF